MPEFKRLRQRFIPAKNPIAENEPGRRSAAKLLSKDEAWWIAVNVARLPELLKRDLD